MKEPKFHCKICDFGSASKQYVTHHTETVHEGKKPFECDICCIKFVTKHKLNLHMLAAHEEKDQFKCDICDDTFTSKGNLKVRFLYNRLTQILHPENHLLRIALLWQT